MMGDAWQFLSEIIYLERILNLEKSADVLAINFELERIIAKLIPIVKKEKILLNFCTAPRDTAIPSWPNSVIGIFENLLSKKLHFDLYSCSGLRRNEFFTGKTKRVQILLLKLQSK